jgi:hypothetical protein
MITFFDIKGIVHFEFIPQVQTVNEAYYVEILKRFHKAVSRKRPDGPTIGFSTMTIVHKALTVNYFLPQKSIT